MSRKKTESNGHTLDGHPQLPAPEAPPEPPPPEPEDHRNLPVHVVRFGTIKGHVWRNVLDDGSVRYACTFARLYRIGPDQWGTSTNFGFRDLPLVEKVAAAAFEWIALQYANDDAPF